VLAAVVAGVAAAGCSDNQEPAQSPLVIAKTATKSGDQQTALVGTALTSPLRVMVTRDGQPVAQTSVAWRADDGGSFGAPSTSTDASGVATATWTLGPNPGTQTAAATIAGAQGSPQTFSATATPDDTPVPTTVSVEGPPTNQFSPATVTIGVGQSVTWVWAEGAADHNVTPDDAIPVGEAGLFDAPHSYTYTFTQQGTYHYHCSNHGAAGGVGMSGTVVVAAAQ
jgi:plastocyanin